MRPTEPKPLSDVIPQVLGASPTDSQALARVTACWESAVGAPIAREAWPTRVQRDGTVVVSCSSSAWMHELTMLSATVAARLAEHIGQAPPLSFQLGRPPRRRASEARSRPIVDDRARAAARVAAASIRDTALRESAERAIAAAIARQMSV